MNIYSIQKQPSNILLEIAKRHKKIRKSQNLSQAALAKRSSVSLGSLKRFETTGQINFESLLKLAHFFDRLEEFNTIFSVQSDNNIAKLFDKKI
jgi:transcriptional regulator with XRE-family HTH domain